ncbi:hypothetical protein F5B18DRAFT_604815 [Nemania serpens]|nr:hypothetical protein F5B18DRAFT_604815 [Nemania serpens]
MDQFKDDPRQVYTRYVCQGCREAFFWRRTELGPFCPRCEPTAFEQSQQRGTASRYTTHSSQAHRRSSLASLEISSQGSTSDISPPPGCLSVIEPLVSQSHADIYPSDPDEYDSIAQLPAIRDVPDIRNALDSGLANQQDYNPSFLSFRSRQDAQPSSRVSHLRQPTQHYQESGSCEAGERHGPSSPRYYSSQGCAYQHSNIAVHRGDGPRHYRYNQKYDYEEEYN